MIKTYISALLIVLLAAAQAVQAQDDSSLDNVFAQLDSADAVDLEVGEAPAVEVVEIDELTMLFNRGLDYYRDGNYDKAIIVFDAMLSIDKYDSRAVTYKKRAAHRIASKEVRKQGATRAEAIAEVDAAWTEAPRVLGVLDTAEMVDTTDPEVVAIEAMTARLKEITVPSLDFRDANIKDVVMFLTETTRRLDPAGNGVNILLLGMDEATAVDSSNITISIRDMSLFDALQYIAEMAALKVEVKSSVVAITPMSYVTATEYVLRSYDIIPDVGVDLESVAGDDLGGGADDLFGDSSASSDISGPIDVVSFFSIVDFPDGATAVYQPRFHKLFVKNTVKNLNALEEVLADLEDEAIKLRSQQVEIEAKFVEFNEGSLEELGFDWTVYGTGSAAGMSFKDGTYFQAGSDMATPGTPTVGGAVYTDPVTGQTQIVGTGQNLLGSAQRSNAGVFESLTSGLLSTMGGAPGALMLTNGDVDLRITAMEQEGTADVLSAPRVTTKSGNEAIIRVVELHRYPQDYDVETGQRTAPVVKPQDWEDFDLGVVLKVIPVVDSESNTIDLDMTPEITKFKGFDNYVVGYNSFENGGNNTSEIAGDGSALIAKMPYFEKRTVQTQVTIADGNTIVMGGLIDERTETFRDQVPFLGDIPYLGRLFRTEGSRTAKKNLVIFVKATQVDDRGMTHADRELARKSLLED